ncbi:MAG TPA: hypothetical protein VLA04_04215 [Verrucomicrobiae bacterium]|nr:hypothetical protein [Verrucomicrobiae bacterium]
MLFERKRPQVETVSQPAEELPVSKGSSQVDGAVGENPGFPEGYSPVKEVTNLLERTPEVLKDKHEQTYTWLEVKETDSSYMKALKWKNNPDNYKNGRIKETAGVLRYYPDVELHDCPHLTREERDRLRWESQVSKGMEKFHRAKEALDSVETKIRLKQENPRIVQDEPYIEAHRRECEARLGMMERTMRKILEQEPGVK